MASIKLTKAAVDINAATNNIIIAATVGKLILVHRVLLLLEEETTVQFKNGSTPQSGPMLCRTMALEYAVEPWYTADKNANLVITLGDAVQCSGTLWYRLADS